MSLSNVLLDTSAIITYRPSDWGKWISVVVLQELTAGANDKHEIASHQRYLNDRFKSGSLLVPDHEDWFQAGRILNTILRNEKRLSSGKQTPRLSEGKKQSLIRDVLIARTAKRHNLTVVSDNTDFAMIQRYYDFDWISGEKFSN